MKSFISVLLLSFLPYFFVHAYVPPTRMILERLTDNSGNGGYELVKEVRLDSTVPLIFKEVWKIENERNLRLTVTPIQSSAPALNILYTGGQKILINGRNREVSKMPLEMSERIFHFRTVDYIAAYLTNLQVLTSALGNLDLAHLNRAQGVVNYGLGKKTEADSSSLAPYIWIEQDRFVVRKVRYDSDIEMTADHFNSYAKGLTHPSDIGIKWKNMTARLRTLSVTSKKWPAPTFQSSTLEDSQKFLQNSLQDPVALDFYTRFR